MPFYEVRFPTNVLIPMKGGNEFSTSVVTAKSGDESRNRAWSQARQMWQVALVAKDSDTRLIAFQAIETFHLCMGGRWGGFRFKNSRDYQFTDQAVGGWNGGPSHGDGATLDFQLQKTYSVGGGLATYTRTILKPVTSSVVDYLGNALSNTITVKVNGTPTSVTVDHTTGKISFNVGSPVVAPPNGAVITASGEFDIPVRFDLDKLDAVNRAKDILDSGQLTLVELKNPQTS